jgi:hypothetical protein
MLEVLSCMQCVGPLALLEVLSCMQCVGRGLANAGLVWLAKENCVADGALGLPGAGTRGSAYALLGQVWGTRVQITGLLLAAGPVEC